MPPALNEGVIYFGEEPLKFQMPEGKSVEIDPEHLKPKAAPDYDVEPDFEEA